MGFISKQLQTTVLMCVLTVLMYPALGISKEYFQYFATRLCRHCEGVDVPLLLETEENYATEIK